MFPEQLRLHDNSDPVFFIFHCLYVSYFISLLLELGYFLFFSVIYVIL